MPQKLIHGLTHNELVKIAGRWLRNTERCSVVLSEMVSQPEEPDAIGWKAALSTLVECKATRDDFRKDRLKPVRINDEGFTEYIIRGMGVYRYYMTPQGLLSSEEHVTIVPRGWGLLEVTFTGRVLRTIRSAQWVLSPVAIGRELGLALSAVRRYQEKEHAEV